MVGPKEQSFKRKILQGRRRRQVEEKMGSVVERRGLATVYIIDIVGILRARVAYYIIKCLFLDCDDATGKRNESPLRTDQLAILYT